MKNEHLAPIEIESAADLRHYGISRKDCETWVIGTSFVTVYLTPAPEEVCEYLTKELWRKYSKRGRETRCMVPGQRKALIRCPECNHCDACPYGRTGEDRQPRNLSLEDLMEDGFDAEGCDFTSETAEKRLELEELFDRLNRIDSRYVRMVELLAAGYSGPEIAHQLGVSQFTVYDSLRKIRRIAREYRQAQV